MKKFTEEQIREGFRAWEQRRRSYPSEFMTCYEMFMRSVEEHASACTKTIISYIEKASV